MSGATGRRMMPDRVVFGSGGQCSVSGIAMPHEDYIRPLSNGERHLGRFIVPPFQRSLVWTIIQKSRLIESIYMGLPIGSIVWNQTTHDNMCDQWLLDGQQRVSAICGYLASEFSVRGWFFSDLPVIEQRHFQRMGIGELVTNIPTEAACRNIYNRLVYGGTPHEPKEICQ